MKYGLRTISVIFDSLVLRVSVTYDTMGPMRDAKKLEATISDIAKATLQNERAVRRHEESGAFDLGDLLSVSRYVVGKRLLATGFDLIGEVVMTRTASLPTPIIDAVDINLGPTPTATTPSHRLPPQPDVKIKSRPLAIEGTVNDNMAAMLAAIGPAPETLSEINPELQQAIEVDEFIGLEKMRSEGTEMTVEELARWSMLNGTAVEKRALRKMRR